MSPGRRQRCQRVVFCSRRLDSYSVSLHSLYIALQAKNAPVGLLILSAAGKVVKCLRWRVDEHAFNEGRSLARALNGIFNAAFPLQHGPACKTVLRQFGEDLFEVNLPIPHAAEATRAILPVLVAAIDARSWRGMIFGVFDMKCLDMVLVVVEIADIVQLLQHEMRGIVENMDAGMVARRGEKAFKCNAVVQVFARMDLVRKINAVLFRDIKQRLPAPCQLFEAHLYQSLGTLGPGIHRMP